MTNIIPAVGSTVEITVEQPNIYYYTYKQQPVDTRVYTGKVVRNEKWLDAKYLSIHTDNTNYPISQIAFTNIKSIKILDGRKDNYKEYPVAGSKGKMYTVSQNGKHYSCTCPGFTYNAKCKHIELVRNDYYE